VNFGPRDGKRFHAELTSRNRGLITGEEQAALHRVRFVLAGCGSTGGACIMPLVRSGADRFLLLDPGEYDLSNLNRQDATLAEIGQNKALASAKRILAVNPFASIQVQQDGVVATTVAELLDSSDLVIDAVDVTTQLGVDAKLALHRAACDLRVPAITAYDIAATQYLELFDYRRGGRPLDGRVEVGDSPDQVLRKLIPPLAVPREIFPELLARRADHDRAFPQLAMTSALLGALIVPYVIRLLTGQPVRRRMRVDLYDLVRPAPQRIAERLRRTVGLASLWWRLRG
jgi:molybdopterin/thiamine biosynthesis adenylyltransferase